MILCSWHPLLDLPFFLLFPFLLLRHYSSVLMGYRTDMAPSGSPHGYLQDYHQRLEWMAKHMLNRKQVWVHWGTLQGNEYAQNFVMWESSLELYRPPPYHHKHGLMVHPEHLMPEVFSRIDSRFVGHDNKIAFPPPLSRCCWSYSWRTTCLWFTSSWLPHQPCWV